MRSMMKRRLAAVTALAALTVPAGVVAATPSQGWTPVLLGRGALDDPLKVNAPNVRGKIRPSDLAVAQVAIAPGGTSGWHIHPGPSMSIVTEGIVTWYEGEDPACTPRVYETGQAFADRGPDHVHLVRNETDQPATILVTFIIPQGEPTLIDAPDPGNCPF